MSRRPHPGSGRRPRRKSAGAGGPIDRLARFGVATAARRWPADLSEIMAREWQAELDAIREDPRHGRWMRAGRTITFAGSLALSPAVEEAGYEPVTWSDRASAATRPAATAAAVTLLAAALFNVVHLAYHHARLTSAGATGVLALAALIMGALAYAGGCGGVVFSDARDPAGSHAQDQALPGEREYGRIDHAGTGPARRRREVRAVRTTALLGAAMFGFLLAGNQVAVMPFMGWIDILPAVATWTPLTALTVVAVTRLVAAGRRGVAAIVAVAGGLITLDLTAVAGSVHAAGVLGIGLGSSPTWFPLAILPGRTPAFGAYFADGAATFGSLRAFGPAFHASNILFGNASAMLGPLLLSSVYVLAGTLRTPGRSAFPGSAGISEPLRLPLAAAGALLTLAASDLMRRSAGGTGEVILHRLLDNSNVFGFGFLAGMPGRIAVTLLAALLIAHAGGPARHPAGPPAH